MTNFVFFSNSGLGLLPSLIVKEIEINLTAKFNFNQAFSNYIQHKYSDAIDSFTKVNSQFDKFHHLNFKFIH